MAPKITAFSHLQIPLEDILKATNNFDVKNIIGDGGLGKVYRGRILRSGKRVKIAARRLDSKHKQGIEFLTEISVLSSLKHENIVSIIGFCDENDEKVIVSSYGAKGSLLMHLSKPTLSWTQRLRICIGIARALSYIHNGDGRNYSVIHRNINSTSILLDDNYDCKLSGFEYSINHLVLRMNHVLLSEAIGTTGYVDPLIVETGGVTHKSDIYSFGVVLWEVLSGRKAYIPDDDNAFLGQRARSHYENKTLNDIILPGLQNQMAPESLRSFSKVAYSCLKDERSHRPDMKYIVLELEKALELQLPYENFDERVQRPDRNYVVDENKRNILEHQRIQLSDITLATNNFSVAYHTGVTGFYDLYTAELEHFDKRKSSPLVEKSKSELPKRSTTVVIKRLRPREDKRGEEVFYTEIEMLTTCKHHNIVTLFGFCNEGFEMIIVVENVTNGYLNEYLENMIERPILNWEQRLKICLDVANGLNYLHHEMEDQKVIINRGLKSRNIALDENLRAKVADFGFSVFLPPNQDDDALHLEWVAGTYCYWDPEYENTGKLKRESDVYSFGVVLLEIFCGKVAYDPIYIKKSDKGLAFVVRRRFCEGTLSEMIDPIIKEESGDKTFTLNRGPNKDSLKAFLDIALKCLEETQDQRPTMKVVVKELENALSLQENNKDGNLRLSFEDIKVATNDFHRGKCIGGGGFGKVYIGELRESDGSSTIVAKLLDKRGGQGELQFWNELQILFEYKHENIIRLLGYCDEKDAKVIVYEYASKRSLNRYLNDTRLCWIKRLNICIDVATALAFLHGGVEKQATVIHRDIKPENILLTDDWHAKLADFGLSLITTINQKTDYVIDRACGTKGYVDQLYSKSGFLTIESDIYAFGVVLFEILCGRLTFMIHKKEGESLADFIKVNLENGKHENRIHDTVVFKEIKEQIMPEALDVFQTIAYRCLNENREKRPKAKEVVEQLKKALELQMSSGDGACTSTSYQ